MVQPAFRSEEVHAVTVLGKRHAPARRRDDRRDRPRRKSSAPAVRPSAPSPLGRVIHSTDAATSRGKAGSIVKLESSGSNPTITDRYPFSCRARMSGSCATRPPKMPARRLPGAPPVAPPHARLHRAIESSASPDARHSNSPGARDAGRNSLEVRRQMKWNSPRLHRPVPGRHK